MSLRRERKWLQKKSDSPLGNKVHRFAQVSRTMQLQNWRVLRIGAHKERSNLFSGVGTDLNFVVPQHIANKLEAGPISKFFLGVGVPVRSLGPHLLVCQASYHRFFSCWTARCKHKAKLITFPKLGCITLTA